jgi:hypothetical protein
LIHPIPSLETKERENKMSEYFINFLKIIIFIVMVCITWIFGGEVISYTSIAVTVIYTVSVIWCLLLGMHIWKDMNSK